MDMKRFFLYAIVIAALALAGCGGNGGGGDMVNGGNGETPMQCPSGTTGTYPNCTPIPPDRPAPPMELVHGIVTANDDDHSATNPAPYTHMDRPGKGTGDAGVVVPLKNDGTFGDVAIGTVAGDGTVTQSGGDLEMSEDMTPPSVGRFADGAVFSRTSMGVTDTVYAYETRSAPGARAWDMHYSTVSGSGREASDIAGLTSITAPTESTTSQKFNVLGFDADVTELRMSFASDMFPSGGSQTYTYHTAAAYDALAPTARGASDIRGQMIDGMFAGVSGTYACTGTCTAATNNRGQVTTLGGTWMFTPNDLATGATGHMVQGVVNDADYLTFGYWVQKDEDDTGDLTIGVSTFASGQALDTTYVSAMNLLEGTAKYDGKAVGKFVLKTLSPTGVGTITDGGTFTADADLTAHFGGNAISFNDRFTIRGTINGFRNDDGDMIDPNWSVTLNKADFSEYDPPSTTTKGTPTTTFSGTTSAGGPAGAWGGGFFGTPMTSAGAVDTPAADNTDAYPTSVAGEFDAHFTNGHALGAFGATR